MKVDIKFLLNLFKRWSVFYTLFFAKVVAYFLKPLIQICTSIVTEPVYQQYFILFIQSGNEWCPWTYLFHKERIQQIFHVLWWIISPLLVQFSIYYVLCSSQCRSLLYCPTTLEFIFWLSYNHARHIIMIIYYRQ